MGVILMTLSLLPSGAALAADAHFRTSHGEPLNDPHLTPGAIFNVATTTICRSGYASGVRDVPSSEKDQVYAEYGIVHHSTNQYEIDHLIPLELGGNNSLANLWPQLNDHPRGYLNSKDILENRLHSLVCARRLSLASAQHQISTDWVATYRHYFGAWPSGRAPTPLPTTTGQPVTPTSSTSTGVRLIIVSSKVAPGETETLSARSNRPHDSCDVTVILPSGRESTADGLGSTSADARGQATWTWRIGSRTDAGTAHVTVTCGGGVARGTFVVS